MFEPGTRIGRYEIHRKLGHGGFGILYIARDHELGRDIAIKFLRSEHSFRPQVVQRFLQEARAAARISHPGIVTVYESGQVTGTNTTGDGTAYIAMELLAGDTLAERLRQGGRMPYRMAIGFCHQIATALAAAHSAGIVHRDLKPQNIFLVRDKAVVGGERVKILDFGIAKLADDMGSAINTQSMVMLGTPMYMSPEQCKSSAKVDARSDIYSLGCILFEMVCGKTPFAGDSGELIAKHQLVPAPSPRSIDPELPVVLDQLITAMLAKKPDERPQTMSSVLDVLEACDERSVEPPTSPSHQVLLIETPGMKRPVLDRRMPLAIGAVAVVAIGLSAVLFLRRKPSAGEQARIAAARQLAAADAPSAEPAPTDAKGEPPPAEAVKDLKIACYQAQLEKRWVDLSKCGTKLDAIAPGEGAGFVAIATREHDNERAMVEPDGAAAAAQPPPGKPTTKATANKSKLERACDAEALKEKGMENINMGQHAAALVQFEASLRCKQDPYVIQLAFMEACSSANSVKAKHYYTQMTSAQQQKFAQICRRQNVPYE